MERRRVTLGKTCFLPFPPLHLPTPKSTTVPSLQSYRAGCCLQLRALPLQDDPCSDLTLPPPQPAHLLRPCSLVSGEGWAPWRETVAAELQTGCWAPGQPSRRLLTPHSLFPSLQGPAMSAAWTGEASGTCWTQMVLQGWWEGPKPNAPPPLRCPECTTFPPEGTSLQVSVRKQRC